MTLEDLLQRILRDPSPDDLWRLHPYLLALDSPEAEHARASGAAVLLLSDLRPQQTDLQTVQFAVGAAGCRIDWHGRRAGCDRGLRRNWPRNSDQRTAGRRRSPGYSRRLPAFSTSKPGKPSFCPCTKRRLWHLYVALWHISVETQPDLPARNAAGVGRSPVVADPPARPGQRRADGPGDPPVSDFAGDPSRAAGLNRSNPRRSRVHE